MEGALALAAATSGVIINHQRSEGKDEERGKLFTKLLETMLLV